ncbi:Serine/threonine-protein kinase HT1 [Hordeum vulgare]|nr:Serine/threonine-protein kinase HT1 [Hordeum vulgare]
MKVAAGTLRLEGGGSWGGGDLAPDGGGSRSGSFVPGAAATGGGGDLRPGRRPTGRRWLLRAAGLQSLDGGARGGGGFGSRGRVAWIWFSRSDDGGIAVSFLSREHRLWSSAGRWWQEVERLRPARSFGGDARSCLADRCYTLSCLVGRCYARQILPSLRVWMDERGEVVPLGAVVASTDGWTDKDYADLSPEDGSTVQG